MAGITYDDINMLEYFFTEKGSVTYWTQWKKKKELFFEQYPELRFAMENLDAAKRNLKAVVANIVKNHVEEKPDG
jgi:hypothetical protein